MNIINLTPYTFQIDKRIIVPDGKICYVEYIDRVMRFVDEIPISERIYGGIVNLPDERDDTIYIVNHTVRKMCRRHDLVSPGKTLKIDDGIIYLESLRKI